MQNSSTKAVKNGFTLIELLVVIAIIALLLSIVMPGLRRAKDYAKKIYCSANLKSLTTAVLLYAEGYNGLSPSSTNFWSDGNTQRAGWCGRTGDLTGPFARDAQLNGNSDPTTGLVRGQLWPYIESPDVWRCPADQNKEHMRSYSMSSQWWGLHSTNNDGVSYDSQTNGMVYRKITNLKGPGQRFMFLDQLGYNTDAYWALYYSQPKWWNIPSYMHSGGSVNSFADGHVEGYKLEAETITLAHESLARVTDTGAEYYMVQDDFPNSDDLKYYQLATWGKIGW